jgi:hypothetical protein
MPDYMTISHQNHCSCRMATRQTNDVLDTQWQTIEKVMRRRVSEKRDPVAMELAGTEAAPLLQVNLFDPQYAIDALTSGIADVAFCGYFLMLRYRNCV